MNAYMLFETVKVKRRLKSELQTLFVCKQNLRPVIDYICVVLV